MLWSLPESIPFIEEDIANDDALFERYGVRIPVLGYKVNAGDAIPAQELGWPFDVDSVMAFLKRVETEC